MLSEYGTALSNTLYERQLKLLSVQNTTKKGYVKKINFFLVKNVL